MIKGSRKKVLFLVAGPLRGERGLNGCATKEKRFKKKLKLSTFIYRSFITV